MDIGDAFDDLNRAMNDAFERQRIEREKLRTDPCMDIPEVGDHVLVNGLVTGRGMNPLEAKVLRVSGSSYELEYVKRREFGTGDILIEWVDSHVVMSVIRMSGIPDRLGG